MAIYQPYFYIIEFPLLGLYYAGIRFAANCHPAELLKNYKTSSTRVHVLLSEGHSASVIEVIPFSDVEQLRAYEVKFLKPKIGRPEWLNRAAGRAILNDAETIERIRRKNTGRKLTDQHKEAISKGGKGRIQTAETRAKMSESKRGVPNPAARERMLGRKRSPEVCENISNGKRGRPLSEKHKLALEKIISANIGAKRSTEFNKRQSETMTSIWQRRVEEKLALLDVPQILEDFASGIRKKDICAKHGLTRDFVNKHILSARSFTVPQ